MPRVAWSGWLVTIFNVEAHLDHRCIQTRHSHTLGSKMKDERCKAIIRLTKDDITVGYVMGVGEGLERRYEMTTKREDATVFTTTRKMMRAWQYMNRTDLVQVPEEVE